MQLSSATLILSATDLSKFLGCPHLSLLDRAVVHGAPRPPKYEDPSLEALRIRGDAHERAYLAELEAEGLSVVALDNQAYRFQHDGLARHASDTLDAMRAGADVIYQGALHDGTWFGKPDFLRRVETPSNLGGWSYEIVDAKLAREAKGGALLQVLLYADLLQKVQGSAPEYVHLALGGPEPKRESFRVSDYAAYFRLLRDRLLAAMAGTPGPIAIGPDPVAHCSMCDWQTRCNEERRAADHLSLVAGISRRQRDALNERGIKRLDDLARLTLPLDPAIEEIGSASLERIHHQARVQLAGREADAPIHELILPVDPKQGLAILPPPSEGDLFLDLEGNPYALTHGLEYLFGFVDRSGEYQGWWALDRESEKAAFERFIDLVMERLKVNPDLHVYHFAPYEPSAFKRLMGFHGTREDEVDHLLRSGVFVDLYRVVRQGIRASVESYSIKKLERFYGYEREMDLRQADHARSRFEVFLEVGMYEEDRVQFADIVEAYNRDDCVSTLRLCEWLQGRRAELERQLGGAIPVAVEEPEREVSEKEQLRRQETARRTALLLDGVPIDEAERTPEQHARWLLAQLLEYYRREKKAQWWEYFRGLELPAEDREEDRTVLGGLQYEGVVDTIARSYVHRYRFPPQEHGVRKGKMIRVIDPITGNASGEVVEIDNEQGFIDLKRGIKSEVPHPEALVPLEDFPDKPLQESLLRVADAVIEDGFSAFNPYRSAIDLLVRNLPRAGQPEGAPLHPEVQNMGPRLRGDDGEGGDDGAGDKSVTTSQTPLDSARELVSRLDHTVLPIQGPPGAGKTYTGARMIVTALKQGKRIGITGPSHKVIVNLLDEVCRAAAKEGVTFRGMQRADEDRKCEAAHIESASNDDIAAGLGSGEVMLAAGTAWLWSREDMIDSVDLLFVDEASQFSLANALAVAPSAKNLVLLGDPQQLDQVVQGTHPPGVAASALDHLLGGEATVRPEAGLFLGTTWRLSPDICAFTSEMFYEDRLHPRAGLDGQVVRAPDMLGGSGVRLIPVAHRGNTSESPEEVKVVAGLIESLLAEGATWVNEEGAVLPLTLKDILIVSPYNAQVAALVEGLPAGARVGTVDKFQGQEAAISIYSVATSSAAEAPRGMEFLYNPNRLNVATSRARCLTIIVASPEIFIPECHTPEQMRLANAFCRFRELAGED